jgi:hypothetical protein
MEAAQLYTVARSTPAPRLTLADLSDLGQAQLEGLSAARHGRSALCNPYRTGALHRAWSEGYTQGFSRATCHNAIEAQLA